MIQQLRMPEPAPTPRSRKPPQDRPKVRPPGQDPGHLLCDQLLSGGKVPECRVWRCLTLHQQAQGKHGNECRGTQLEIADRQTLPVSIFYGKGDTASATIIPSG